jgi:hypothetical protein
MYATAKISSCSAAPAPTSCNLLVYLYSSDPTRPALESENTRWSDCKAKSINTPAWTCVIGVEENYFHTQGTLEIESPAGSDTGNAVSGNERYYCTA